MSQKTTYVIYRIWNTISGKSYIGQTSNFKQRKILHFAELKKGTHFNHHLQKAYRKYGRESFNIQILEGVTSKEELDSREVYWIEYFNACSNGYNLTKGGHNNAAEAIKKRVVWNGIEFTSMTEAAQYLGVHRLALRKLLLKGYVCDSDVPPKTRIKGARSGKAITFNGITYPSVKDLAQTLGMNINTVYKRVKLGLPITNSKFKREVAVTIDGKNFNSLIEAAQHYAVSPTMIRSWIKKGKARLI